MGYSDMKGQPIKLSDLSTAGMNQAYWICCAQNKINKYSLRAIFKFVFYKSEVFTVLDGSHLEFQGQN